MSGEPEKILFSKALVFVCDFPTEEELKNSIKIEPKSSKSFYFTIDNQETEWSMHCYPNGYNATTNGFVSVFLRISNAKTANFQVRYRIGLVDRTAGEAKYTIVKNARRASEFSKGLGYKQLLSHAEVFAHPNRFVVDKKVQISCKIDVLEDEDEKKKPSEAMPIAQAVAMDTLSDWKRMFQESTYSDYQITCNDDHVFNVHKCILSARSSVFSEKIEWLQKVNSTFSNLYIPHDAAIVKELLRFIYYGQVENLDRIADKLVVVAAEFKVDMLIETCCSSMIALLTIENVIDRLIIAESLKNGNFYNKCVEMIEKNYIHIQLHASWERLSMKSMMKICEAVILKSPAVINI